MESREDGRAMGWRESWKEWKGEMVMAKVRNGNGNDRVWAPTDSAGRSGSDKTLAGQRKCCQCLSCSSKRAKEIFLYVTKFSISSLALQAKDESFIPKALITD